MAKRIPIEFHGVLYKSHAALAKAYGVDPYVFRARLRIKNWSLEQALGLRQKETTRDGTSVSFQNVRYTSYRELAIAHGVEPKLFYARFKTHGWSLEQALGLSPPTAKKEDACAGFIYKIEHRSTGRCYIGLTTRSVAWRFKVHVYNAFKKFHSNKLAAALRKYGPDAFTITVLARSKSRARLSRLETKYIAMFHADTEGFNTHKGGGLGSQNGVAVVYEGKAYHSMADLCSDYAVPLLTFYDRRHKGWALDECVRGRNFRKQDKV